MKKNKQTKYLLAAVIIIYGAVAARFVFLGDSSVAVESMSIPKISFKNENEIKQFSIQNNYRDPFLGTIPYRKNNNKVNLVRRKDQKKMVVFPTIIYKGLVSDSKNQKRIFAIEINQEEQIVTQGIERNGIKVIDGDRDKIRIQYQEEIKIINRVNGI